MMEFSRSSWDIQFLMDNIHGGIMPHLSFIMSAIPSVSGTHYTKGLRANSWNLVKILFALIMISIISSGHKFAHVTTAYL